MASAPALTCAGAFAEPIEVEMAEPFPLGAVPRLGSFPYVFVIVKPNGVKQNAGSLIQTLFEKSGFVLVNQCFHHNDIGQDVEAKFAEHYIEHKDKDFYSDLVTEMSNSGPFVSLIYRYPACPKTDAHPATTARDICKVVRAMFQESVRHNAIHVSNSEAASRREIAVWMGEDFVSGCL